jgi:hypothetical protein
MSVATFGRSREFAARTTGSLDKPAVRAQDWCVLTLTSRFMNVSVSLWQFLSWARGSGRLPAGDMIAAWPQW